MISKSELWSDIRDQADEWRARIKTRYQTGYGGQNKPNASITAHDFKAVKLDWKRYGEDHKLETRTAASMSSKDKDVIDFICHAHGRSNEAFVYRVIVPGISSNLRVVYC